MTGVGKTSSRPQVTQSTPVEKTEQPRPAEAAPPSTETPAAAPSEAPAQSTVTTQSRMEAAIMHAKNVGAGLVQQALFSRLGFGVAERAKHGLAEAAKRAAQNAAEAAADAAARDAGPPERVPLQGIPPRPADAMGGKEFAQKIANLPPDKRDKAILEEIEKGNVPESMRNLEPVTVKRMGPDGKEHEIKTYVLPDYIAIGSDKDNVRVPMMPQTAQRIADKTGCSLPTRRMVDDIYANADQKIAFKPLHGSDQYRTSGKAIGDHEQGYAGQGQGPGIRAGHKKDIFIPAPDGKVGVYGGFDEKGNAVHPKFRTQAHGDFYVDYSHGARMVSQTVYVDGKATPLDQALRDPGIAPMLNDEGVMDRTRYPTTSKTYPNL